MCAFLLFLTPSLVVAPHTKIKAYMMYSAPTFHSLITTYCLDLDPEAASPRENFSIFTLGHEWVKDAASNENQRCWNQGLFFLLLLLPRKMHSDECKDCTNAAHAVPRPCPRLHSASEVLLFRYLFNHCNSTSVSLFHAKPLLLEQFPFNLLHWNEIPVLVTLAV